MKLKVSLGNIKETVPLLKKYRQDLDGRCREFLRRLAELGLKTAEVRFRSAQYDGTNDVGVKIEWDDDQHLRIVAAGKAVTFIEFGAGTFYSEDHPLAAEKGAVRGQYGQGKGSNESWTYYGDPGTNGSVVREADKGTVVRTKGNPPARAMYEASKAMRSQIMQIAKEVFST